MDTFLTDSYLILNQTSDFFETHWPEAEVDLEEGILTVTLPDGEQYAINRQGVMRQIWIASPFTGAHHFEHLGEKWTCTRTQVELFDFLTHEHRSYGA